MIIDDRPFFRSLNWLLFPLPEAGLLLSYHSPATETIQAFYAPTKLLGILQYWIKK
jgi:hypothetical protein